MELLDDDGNLFGVVNVVDALVVLLVLAVVAAGAAFVLQPAPEEPDVETTHVTLDLGTQPDYLVSAINEGDSHNAGGESKLTITDVHLTPQGDQTRVIVRAELHGLASGDSIDYANAPPRLGRALDISTATYQVGGRIRAIGQNDTLSTDRTTVVLSDTMSAANADEVTQGDEIQLAGRTVATVEDVAVYATDDSTQRRVIAEATLETYTQFGERRFGNTPVKPGQTVTLPASDYTLDGQIDRVGAGLERGSADVLIEDVVDVETADRITEGDVATVAGHDTATVESVTSYATQNPDRKRVAVGLSLETLTQGERERFGTTPVQRGNAITADFGSYELGGTIERVGALEPRGAVTTRTVTLQMYEVREDLADAIQPGMAERSDGETIARVTDVETEPSVIITTGENGEVHVVDHPYNRKVTITAELRVRETTSGLTFKGESLRQGTTVVIDLGTITVEATVVGVGG
ncbi:DUF4330 domain-containing protein [Halolamina sp. C58]|uniref:DUF4330 domain-containing protein n=1 Tax=Halolamina sp. C58 TaxID=3421640 RepID=UPI003EB6D2D8